MLKAFLDFLSSILKTLGAFYAGRLAEEHENTLKQEISNLEVENEANVIRLDVAHMSDDDVMHALRSEYGRPMPSVSNDNGG